MSHLFTTWRIAVVALVACGLTAASAHASLTFFDGTFDQADWTTPITNNDGPAYSITQESEGGNPGSFGEVRVTFGDGEEPGEGGDLHLFTSFQSAVWDPSVDGELPGIIHWSVDLLNLSGNVPVFYFALRQGDTVYRLNGEYFNPPNPPWQADPVWTTFSASDLTAEDFHEYIKNIVGNTGESAFDPNVHPDFSATGGLIEFGYAVLSGADTGDPTRFAGIDNWSLSVIPEPASMALLGLGSLLILGRRRTAGR